MNESNITIIVNWTQIGTFFGTVLFLTWLASKKLSTLETDVQWLKSGLQTLLTKNENSKDPLYQSNSPISLTPKGSVVIEESGMREYLDKNIDELLAESNILECCSNPYDVQEETFKFMDSYKFPVKFNNRLKQYAFDKGVSTNILRRVGGIYLRDRLLEKMGMLKTDIDKHAPKTEE